MKISFEKRIIKKMIRLYCRMHHGRKFCEECNGLLEYATKKLDKCPFGDSKPSCKDCTIHCYQKDKAEKIKKVMRFSGPRLIFLHPIDTFSYIYRKKLWKAQTLPPDSKKQKS